MKKRRKEHLSGDVEEFSSVDTNSDGTEDVIFIPRIEIRRKRFLLFLIVGIISIVNICFFFFSWELSHKYSMINISLRKLEMCQNQLRNLKDYYDLKLDEKEVNHKDIIETVGRMYEIGSSEKEEVVEYKSSPRSSSYNPTNSGHLKDVIEELARSEHFKNNLPGEIKIAIADLLWLHQKEDHQKVQIPSDKWMGFFNIFPPTVSCDTLIRVGSTGDGGKYVCNLHKLIGMKKKGEVVRIYSFGVQDDISFDLHLSQMIDNCEIHLFDPTVDLAKHPDGFLPSSHPFYYHQTGLGPIDYGLKNLEALELLVSKLMMYGKSIKMLDEISSELSHEHIDILKIDIEYTEVPVFEYIFEHNLLERLKVKIVLVEYHAPFSLSQELDIIRSKGEYTDEAPPPNSLFKMRKSHLFPFLERFYDGGFYLYSSEPNTRFLRGIEYGFVHRSLLV